MKLIYIICASLVLLSSRCLADAIVLRTNSQVLQGTILSGGASGVQLEHEDESRGIVLIPWSTILTIDTNRPTPRLDTLLRAGQALYNAKLRLLRGDVMLAESQFSEAFASLEGSNCIDARLASEGLLRCALARGDLSTSVQPWLETVRLEELEYKTAFPQLEPVLDESTMLSPHLPPVWIHTEAVMKHCKEYQTSRQESVASIASILCESTDLKTSSVFGVEDSLFLTQILSASKGDAEARGALLARIEGLTPWKKTWAHYFIATGYLEHATPQDRTKGLLHLAKVAAASKTIQPWITGAAMIRLSDELAIDGLVEESRRILSEAARYFPTHPLLKHDAFQIRNSVR